VQGIPETCQHTTYLVQGIPETCQHTILVVPGAGYTSNMSAHYIPGAGYTRNMSAHYISYLHFYHQHRQKYNILKSSLTLVLTMTVSQFLKLKSLLTGIFKLTTFV
jgi:hypothetical protein